MQNLEEIAERIHQSLSERTTARDRALTQSRALTRRCAHAIRAAHRNERAESLALLAEARTLAQNFQTELKDHPDLYFAGYTQDALKEYAEASIVYALLGQETLPTPEDLGLEPATYLQGLAEAAGEFRRGCLDLLRTGQAQEA